MALELRWFFQGPLPPEIAQWCRSGTLGGMKAERKLQNDIYCRQAGCPHIGLKLRDGEPKKRKLELKALMDENPFSIERPSVKGMAQRWDKRSWKNPVYEDRIMGQLTKASNDSWIEVKKMRYQRFFKIGDENEITSIKDNENRDADFVLELTKLTVQGTEWWTIAIDAYGNGRDEGEVMRMAVEYIFSHYPRSPPIMEESDSYPGWLAKL